MFPRVDGSDMVSEKGSKRCFTIHWIDENFMNNYTQIKKVSVDETDEILGKIWQIWVKVFSLLIQKGSLFVGLLRLPLAVVPSLRCVFRRFA